MSEDDQVSALRDNINRKGNNAYYYAHGNTADGPTWDGKEEPRLLSTSERTSRKHFSQEFESFSWMDNDSNIKIYIDFAEAGDVADDDISLVHEGTAMEFSIVSPKGQRYSLILKPLFNEVEKISYRKKADKFVLTLKKVEEEAWSSLKKSS